MDFNPNFYPNGNIGTKTARPLQQSKSFYKKKVFAIPAILAFCAIVVSAVVLFSLDREFTVIDKLVLTQGEQNVNFENVFKGEDIPEQIKLKNNYDQQIEIKINWTEEQNSNLVDYDFSIVESDFTLDAGEEKTYNLKWSINESSPSGNVAGRIDIEIVP